jgi:hypothetical protein
MNNEFEWRKQMRGLGGPVEPARDLWPAIAARVAGASGQARPRRRIVTWIALAATLIVAVGAGTLAYRRHGTTGVAPAAAVAQAPATTGASPARVDDQPRTALDWAIPSDPGLAASAQKLDDASARLQEALEQRPDAVFLVGLLNRTNAQRLRLMRKSPYSG